MLIGSGFTKVYSHSRTSFAFMVCGKSEPITWADSCSEQRRRAGRGLESVHGRTLGKGPKPADAGLFAEESDGLLWGSGKGLQIAGGAGKLT